MEPYAELNRTRERPKHMFTLVINIKFRLTSSIRNDEVMTLYIRKTASFMVHIQLSHKFLVIFEVEI
jgi:hypothetical protein